MKFEYTVTAKSVEDAYSKAVSLYSSVGEIVNTEIICEGKKGFLGIFGSQLAEIKVTVDDGGASLGCAFEYSVLDKMGYSGMESRLVSCAASYAQCAVAH